VKGSFGKSKGEKKTMETQATTRRELETALIEKCWKDPEFKKAVVSDPKGMLERHTGRKLPAQVKIIIHEEDANTLHLSIPPAPSNLTELSDQDLERVAGGTDISMAVSLSLGILGVTMGAGGAAASLAGAGINPW
jgi:hypothetical protein